MCRDDWSAVENHFGRDAVWLLAARNISAASDSLPPTQKLRSRVAGIATARENVAGISANMCQGRVGDSAVTSDHSGDCSVSTSDFLPLGGGERKKMCSAVLPEYFERDLWLSVRPLSRCVISGIIRGVRSSLFCDVTQSTLVVSHRRFETIFWSHLHGSNSPTSGTNYQSTLRNVKKKTE